VACHADFPFRSLALWSSGLKRLQGISARRLLHVIDGHIADVMLMLRVSEWWIPGLS